MGEWAIEHVVPPWGERASIYEHIAHRVVGGRLPAERGSLPDDGGDDGGVRWVAGGRDGAFAHHFGAGGADEIAESIYMAIRRVLRRADDHSVSLLYDLLLDSNAIEYIDPLVQRIVEAKKIEEERLERLALWLATHAPDREPTKVGVALLGLFQGGDHRELFMTVGLHEEMTLYAAVALGNSLSDPTPSLFELSKNVRGWGRIQTVERLADTDAPEVRRWLLTEGYKNDVMWEYLAHICATTGRLAEALSADRVDADLLRGAGDLLGSLADGVDGPCPSLDDYEDGPEAVRRYLAHLAGAEIGIHEVLVVDRLRRFLDDPGGDWQYREQMGWSADARAARLQECEDLLARDQAREAVLAGLDTDDPRAFMDAADAADAIGLDAWPRRYERLAGGTSSDWLAAMQTDEAERAEKVIALAEERLPLDEIACGAALEHGLGPRWGPHHQLDMVLQELRRFPHCGWNLIRAGLRSPVVRTRTMAIAAFAPWDRARWPEDARLTLLRAREDEPDDELVESLTAVLGES